MAISRLALPQSPHSNNRRYSGSFMLTNELTRHEMQLQDSQQRPDLKRHGSTAPYVSATVVAEPAQHQTQENDYTKSLARLEFYYLMVKRQILHYQHESLGLYVTDKADAEDGHVRDMIYANAAVWAVSRAYKRIDDDHGRANELGQCAVKCMRGILYCWMNQADLLEKFKNDQIPLFALHSRFRVLDGDPIGDSQYPHLQIDVVALYLLYLTQMIESGLKVIFTMEEVHLVQNLVFYLERAYRIPDFGMWERGDKYNTGNPELHASSIGMAKVALESINGFNLFGEHGASWSVVYADVDAHNRNRTTLETMLPRESSSKNTDASLIPTLSYPCFAVHKPVVFKATMDKMQRKLLGKYGFKRFLRDGFGTVLEDKNRRYYEPAEVKQFDGIECEWPVFFVYLIIDGVFHGDTQQVETFQKLLEPLLKESFDGDVVLPRYYYVPSEFIEAEIANPGSQDRLPSTEDPDGEGEIFVWGQALFIISQLLVEGLIDANELDPLRRYMPAAHRPLKKTRYSSFSTVIPTDLAVQVVLIAESVRLQALLATYGVQTQTPHQIEPIQIWSPKDLTEVYSKLGEEDKLGLSGRPKRPFGPLSTSKIYRVAGETAICYPLFFEMSDFYLSYDQSMLMDDIRTGLAFVASRWKVHGRPTMLCLVREEMVRGQQSAEMLKLLASFRLGDCNGIRVRTGFLQNFLSSSCIEHLDFVVDLSTMKRSFQSFKEIVDPSPVFRSLMDVPRAVSMRNSATHKTLEEYKDRSVHDVIDALNCCESSHGQSYLLAILLRRQGNNFVVDSVNNVTVQQRLESLIRQCATLKKWDVVRYCSALLQKVVASLAPSITTILVRGKQVRVGMFKHEEAIIDKPVTPLQIKQLIYSTCEQHHPSAAVLQQELLLSIGKLVETMPSIFDGMLKIRIGWIVQALTLYLKYSQMDHPDFQEEYIYTLSPFDVQDLLLEVLTLPSLIKQGLDPDTESHKLTPMQRRHLDGCLNRVPRKFYDCFWNILHRCNEGIKVADHLMPQIPTVTDMTLYELNFALKIDALLDRIEHPAYRQLVVELVMVINTILERNPELYFIDPLDTDKFVHAAFERFLKDYRKRDGAADKKEYDIDFFYQQPPQVTGMYLAGAVVDLLLHQEAEYSVQCAADEACCIV
ncbi:phosphorylase b kinase regulatory subunit beta-like [Paramacrobiotus metropolitanus]|uniref:phosphorylase b kinase regulatory subunit beta-like n=1 Tax=Paramacrobiotus metropolitanus TaxID=2943436 RepID=UPI002445B03F|nr:phosphorylase b kinase regulatory subunit beta-like [Paramacrobiotus metropolitanus]